MRKPLRRMGLVDVDTSHAWVLGNYLRATGRARVSHVVDSGLCRSAAYMHRLAAAFGAEICGDVNEIVGAVDGALLLAARYDNRLERAAPLLKAGVPLFFDKPAAGTIGQVDLWQCWIDRGYPLLCGSSLPYCPELARIARLVQDGAPAALLVLGCREFFEHGIHAADIALSIVQAPVRRVGWSAFGSSELLWVETESPTQLAITTEARARWCVAANGVAGNAVTTLDVDFHRDCHYARLMRAFVDVAEGRPAAIAPQWHLEAIRLLIAGARARETGRAVEVADLLPTDGFDGQRYAAEYAKRCRASEQVDAPLEPSPAVLLAPAGSDGRPLRGWARRKQTAREAVVRLLGPRGRRIVKTALGIT